MTNTNSKSDPFAAIVRLDVDFQFDGVVVRLHRAGSSKTLALGVGLSCNADKALRLAVRDLRAGIRHERNCDCGMIAAHCTR